MVGAARVAQRRTSWLLSALPTTILAAAMAPGNPAALPSLTSLRRRATTATRPQARAAPGARQLHQLVVAGDLSGVAEGLSWPTVDDGIGDGSRS